MWTLIRVGRGSRRITQTISTDGRKVISLTRHSSLSCTLLSLRLLFSAAPGTPVPVILLLQVEISHFHQYESLSAVSRFRKRWWSAAFYADKYHSLCLMCSFHLLTSTKYLFFSRQAVRLIFNCIACLLVFYS